MIKNAYLCIYRQQNGPETACVMQFWEIYCRFQGDGSEDPSLSSELRAWKSHFFLILTQKQMRSSDGTNKSIKGKFHFEVMNKSFWVFDLQSSPLPEEKNHRLIPAEKANLSWSLDERLLRFHALQHQLTDQTGATGGLDKNSVYRYQQ